MIDKKEIQKIAALAKIEIKDSEIDTYSKQLSKILEYVERLNEVYTSKVDEFSGDLLNNQQNLRDDTKGKLLNREEITKLAPESDGIYFKVPKVIKEEGE